MNAMAKVVEAIRDDPVLVGAALDDAILRAMERGHYADSYVLRLRSLRVLVDASIDEALRQQSLVTKVLEVLS